MLSRACQRAPRLITFWSPPWPRPRTTRSRSDPWLPLETISRTRESRRNGAIPQTGPPVRVKKKKKSVLAANMAAHSYRRHSCETYSSLFIGHHCAYENDLLSCFCFPLAAWAVHPIYFFIAMCVTVAFLVMYCTIPACQRSVVFVPPPSSFSYS